MHILSACLFKHSSGIHEIISKLPLTSSTGRSRRVLQHSGNILPDNILKLLPGRRRDRLRRRHHPVLHGAGASARARLGDARHGQLYDLLGHGHVLADGFDHPGDGHVLLTFVPAVVIGSQRHRGVADLGLAGEFGLLQCASWEGTGVNEEPPATSEEEAIENRPEDGEPG